jgi:hypothetical protein
LSTRALPCLHAAEARAWLGVQRRWSYQFLALHSSWWGEGDGPTIVQETAQLSEFFLFLALGSTCKFSRKVQPHGGSKCECHVFDYVEAMIGLDFFISLFTWIIAKPTDRFVMFSEPLCSTFLF